VTHTYGYGQTVCFERAQLAAQLTSAIVLGEQLEIARSHVSVRVLNLETDVGEDEVAVLEAQTSCPEALTREARHRRSDSCGLSAGGAGGGGRTSGEQNERSLEAPGAPARTDSRSDGFTCPERDDMVRLGRRQSSMRAGRSEDTMTTRRP
jgi:hypothetical protein